MAAKASPRRLKTAATLTIHGPGRMSARGRRDIIAWLKKQAAHLARHGEQYTDGRFRAGFHYS
jgi:hypothetical protein